MTAVKRMDIERLHLPLCVMVGMASCNQKYDRGRDDANVIRYDA